MKKAIIPIILFIAIAFLTSCATIVPTQRTYTDDTELRLIAAQLYLDKLNEEREAEETRRINESAPFPFPDTLNVGTFTYRRLGGYDSGIATYKLINEKDFMFEVLTNREVAKAIESKILETYNNCYIWIYHLYSDHCANIDSFWLYCNVTQNKYKSEVSKKVNETLESLR